ncbi:MAG: hypothetical protein IZT60_08540 [Gammaproteobacteria bacterium]|nr:hypothetical protein [Gammaproteobacteria bacterium]
MSVSTLFSDADLQKIRETVATAESRNAGEIVPYLVGRVDDYEEARWRGATLCALLMALLAGAIHSYAGFWGDAMLLWMTLPTMTGVGLGYLLAGLPLVGRALLTDDDIDKRVQWRAESAFLEENLFATHERTGILIFLAIYERRAVILADEGINGAVPEGVWRELVDELVSGIHAGRAADALCDAIEHCARVLQEHHVERHSDDTNELIDGLRIRER